MPPDLNIERARGGLVAGVDEVGRGPWAGPVVAAAVILDGDAIPQGIDDSKALTRARREVLFAALQASATIGVGQATVDEIEHLNILTAAMLAMARAVEDLGVVPGHALIDGNRAPDLPCPSTTVVGGDRRSLSIAAASIIAKVTRDALMARLAADHPGYGWERNAGYGTAEHRAALDRLGVTEHHRRGFKPIARRLEQDPIA
ncbi:MAG: ribonuclease HII [Proteobacteria bacterium]|nr:ribonuclease HII [Pseudomonadota bacterium]